VASFVHNCGQPEPLITVDSNKPASRLILPWDLLALQGYDSGPSDASRRELIENESWNKENPVQYILDHLSKNNLHFAGLIKNDSLLRFGCLDHSIPSFDLYTDLCQPNQTLPFFAPSATIPYSRVAEELFFLKVDGLRRSFLPLL
jgi:hypothetical protein